MLVATLPEEHIDLLRVLERKEKVVACAEESVGCAPRLATEPTEFVAVLVLADYDRILKLTAPLEESEQTAAVRVHSIDPLPIILSHVAGEVGAQVTDLNIAEDCRGVRLLRQVLYHFRIYEGHMLLVMLWFRGLVRLRWGNNVALIIALRRFTSTTH